MWQVTGYTIVTSNSYFLKLSKKWSLISIYKKNKKNKQNFKNYYPILLLPMFSKMYEKILLIKPADHQIHV